MPVHPELVAAIDHARLEGATADVVVAHLQKLGVQDPQRVIQEYTQTRLHDGRPRGQVNPGDPAEWQIARARR